MNVNELLGFEIGDLKTGKKLHRVEVPGFKKGPVKRHGCPSHGIGLTPDEKEVWVVGCVQRAGPRLRRDRDAAEVRDEREAPRTAGLGHVQPRREVRLPSTGEVIDTATKKIVAALTDEKGRPVHSEKMVEIHFRDGKPVAAGDQFGLGRKVKPD